MATRTYRLISWNVNGVRSVCRKGFMDFLGQEGPDILCLQETKALPDQVPPELTQHPAYHSSWHSADKKGYSGVATLSRVKPLDVIQELDDPFYHGEGRVLRTDFDHFTLINVYFPNAQRELTRLDYKLGFSEVFLQYANQLRQTGKRLVICGDFNTAHKNIDLKNWQANQKNSGFLPAERAWMDRWIANGYVDTFRHCYPERENEYTWWAYFANARAKNIGWRIDYFFVSNDLTHHMVAAGIRQDITGSDHCPVTLELKF